jgi:hypothetical protein
MWPLLGTPMRQVLSWEVTGLKHRQLTVREEGKGETVVTTPDRLDWFSCLKRLHALVS